jgi:Leucine-rich repeat (LRR) protein
MPPWTINQLLARHQQCQLAAVDLLHIPVRVPAADGDVTSSGSDRMPPQLLYLRLAAAPQHWGFGGQLLVLDVSGDGVCGSELPDAISACSGLRHLSLDDPQLRSLPASIGSLARLLTLDVSGCEELQRLPDSIGSLASLQTLDIGNCRALLQLPDSIGSLASLITLDMSDCDALLRLPDSIGNLASLQTLDVNYCTSLRLLPDSIGSLASLQTLDVNSCINLQRLPDSIGSLAKLKVLNASCCDELRQLPNLHGLASLEELHVWESLLGAGSLRGLSRLTKLEF